MRVAIVCSAGIVSGKEIMALELGQGLRDSGVEVDFVTSRWGSGEFARRTKAAGFPTYSFWLGFISATLRFDAVWMTLDQLWHWPLLMIAYRHFLKTACPDKVVHTNWHHLLLLLPLLRRERDIFWLHEVLPSTPRFRRLFQRFAPRLACFVAVSHAVGDSLKRIDVPSAKIEVVYNGLQDPFDGCQREGSDSRAAIGIAGQIAPWKGYDDLLRAFQIVCGSSPSAELHLFGTGQPEYESQLRDLARELGISERLTWHGFLSDRSAIYRHLAILVVPSHSEDPLPTSAIEAAFFEIPVVASRRGGLVEIVEDGVTGYLFEPGDLSSLAQRLLDLLGDSDLRRKMGRNARDRATRLFSRDRFVQDFMDLLELKAADTR